MLEQPQVHAQGRYRIWDDDGRGAFAGWSEAGDGDGRIGPVYTPPGSRGRGYATSLVAHVSDDALAHGSTRCYLHTDMANPTSNAIYRRIGYERVCDAANYRFEPQAAAETG